MLQLRAIDAVVSRALDEDLASGDLTSQACIDAGTRAAAEAIARQPLVVAGGEVFKRAFQLVDPAVEVELVVGDGQRAALGAALWRVRGAARSMLSAERVALNFAQRMCGIATLARAFADARPPGTTARITDTRKTTPGLRLLERYAVRCGGAHNHRDNLGSAVMIKDNHIVAAGGIVRAVERARARAPHTSRIEVEVTTLAEVDQAIDAAADVILLDNMDTPTIEKAVARCRTAAISSPSPDASGRMAGPIIEVSGRVTLQRVAELCLAGVDVISVGALTHSAPAADISLEFMVGR